MSRITGRYQVTRYGGEEVRAFIPAALPPADPPLRLEGNLEQLLTQANASIGGLVVAGEWVSSADWFLYGFVRKEALITSQIEGTQATLRDVLTFEAGQQAERPDDVRDVCNYVAALNYARREIRRPAGLPLSTRLLCEAHRRLMKGVRGGDMEPGEIRRSQNWIGGTRPGNARFVPPPPEAVGPAMSALEKWIHGSDPLPPLVRAGIAHVQFETIHPFLDGNGRIGRLLVTLLLEHWGLIQSPLLYLSVAFKRNQKQYYAALNGVRENGDWEEWTRYFLECATVAADDGVSAAKRLFFLIGRDRVALGGMAGATVAALRLFEMLPGHPMITLARAMKLLRVSKPTAGKAIDVLVRAGILGEVTGQKRDRVYAYQGYLHVLTQDTE